MIVKRLQIETRPRLQSAFIFAHINDSIIDVDRVEVSFKEGFLCVRYHDEVETFNFKKLRIKEDSLSSKQIFANCILFRMITDQKTSYYNLSGGFKAELMQLTNKFKQNLNVTSFDEVARTFNSHPIKSDIPYDVLCKRCKSILCKLTFKRVLPLPSSEQNDWFCHCSRDQQIEIAPKITDLLYSEYHYLLNPNQTVGKIERIGKFLRCKQCLSWLGTRSDEKSNRFYFNTTVFQPVEYDESGGSQFTTSGFGDVCNLIKSIAEDVHILTPKIVLSCQIGETVVQFLLLRVYDANLQLQLHENGIVKDAVVAKVFFTFVSNRNELVNSWCKDVNAHSVTVSRPMLEECLSHLREKQRLMPFEFAEDVDGLSGSYLMYDQH